AELFLAQNRSPASMTKEDAHDWLDAVRKAIADHASDAGHEIGTPAPSRAATPQASQPMRVVFWPERGEFANTTFFVTDAAAADHLRFEHRHGSIAEIALLSDGIEPLVLHYASRTIHAPFFDRMFGPVRRSKVIGEDLALSQDLQSYLSSPAILERTDDQQLEDY